MSKGTRIVVACVVTGVVGRGLALGDWLALWALPQARLLLHGCVCGNKWPRRLALSSHSIWCIHCKAKKQKIDKLPARFDGFATVSCVSVEIEFGQHWAVCVCVCVPPQAAHVSSSGLFPVSVHYCMQHYGSTLIWLINYLSIIW